MDNLVYKYFTLKNTIVFVVLILLLIMAFKNPDITLMLFVAFVFACSLNPLVDKLSKHMSRELSAAIVLVSFILLLCIALLPILYICAFQITTFAESFPKYIHNMGILINSLKEYQSLKWIDISTINLDSYFSFLAQNTGVYIDKTLTFLKGFGSAFIQVLVTIIFTFFFMADKNNAKKTFLRLFPATSREKIDGIFNIIAQKTGGYVIAQGYAILSVGIVMTIGLLIFRNDYAVLMGLITAILDLIPVVGPAIALVICIIATYQTGLVPVIGVIVSFTLAQIIENNFVRPYAFSKLLDLHPLIIFLFLFLGAKYFGVIGALFAPAMAVVICVLIEELYMKNIE